jgi:hypothetical protein
MVTRPAFRGVVDWENFGHPTHTDPMASSTGFYERYRDEPHNEWENQYYDVSPCLLLP